MAKPTKSKDRITTTESADADGEKKPALFVTKGSVIHGRGLYARNDIEKDTWIVQYLGKLVDKEESDRIANELLDSAKETGGAKVYMFILNDEWDIDGNVSWNPARLMNHSCDPNVEAQTWQDKEIWFVALRDIKKGEELVFNYGFDLECWEDHPCRCGSPKCVGHIAGEEYWPKLKRKIAAKKSAAKRKAAAVAEARAKKKAEKAASAAKAPSAPVKKAPVKKAVAKKKKR